MLGSKNKCFYKNLNGLIDLTSIAINKPVVDKFIEALICQILEAVKKYRFALLWIYNL